MRWVGETKPQGTFQRKITVAELVPQEQGVCTRKMSPQKVWACRPVELTFRHPRVLWETDTPLLRMCFEVSGKATLRKAQTYRRSCSLPEKMSAGTHPGAETVASDPLGACPATSTIL